MQIWNQASKKPLILMVGDPEDQLLLRKLFGIANVIYYPNLHDTGQLPKKECSEAVIMAFGYTCIVNRSLMDRSPKLKIIISLATGYDNIDIEYASELGIVVCNLPDYSIEEVADTALAHFLTLFRHTSFLHQAIYRGEVIKDHKEFASRLRRIRGKTLGLVGLGKIGTAVAVRALAFGFHVIFYDPFIADGWDTATIGRIERFYSLAELVQKSDCVSLHCVLTAETTHIINESLLRMFKKNAFLVNVARGGLVDESALANALKQGWIGGAALDVYEKEPFCLKDSPLNSAPNLICTPHIAWNSTESLKEYKTSLIKLLQLACSTDCSTIPNCVNKQYLNCDAVQAHWSSESNAISIVVAS